MLKQISTYGAAILTTMVVIRAATMKEESKSEIRSLYERTTDQTYVTNNLDFRQNYNPVASPDYFLLADNLKSPLDAPVERTINFVDEEGPSSEEYLIYEPEISEVSDIVILEEELTGSDGLSLDRESTISSNLSTLFPRQRINPKPSPF